MCFAFGKTRALSVLGKTPAPNFPTAWVWGLLALPLISEGAEFLPAAFLVLRDVEYTVRGMKLWKCGTDRVTAQASQPSPGFISFGVLHMLPRRDDVCWIVCG